MKKINVTFTFFDQDGNPVSVPEQLVADQAPSIEAEQLPMTGDQVSFPELWPEAMTVVTRRFEYRKDSTTLWVGLRIQ